MRWRLSDREVERLLSNLEIQSFASRDELEVAGYAEVIATVFASGAEISVTENHIKQIHRDLLRYGDKDERHRGEYKTASTSVAVFDADGNQVGVVCETERLAAAPQRTTCGEEPCEPLGDVQRPFLASLQDIVVGLAFALDLRGQAVEALRATIGARQQ